MEYKTGKATVRVHGTINQEVFKKAAETFLKKAQVKKEKKRCK